MQAFKQLQPPPCHAAAPDACTIANNAGIQRRMHSTHMHVSMKGGPGARARCTAHDDPLTCTDHRHSRRCRCGAAAAGEAVGGWRRQLGSLCAGPRLCRRRGAGDRPRSHAARGHSRAVGVCCVHEFRCLGDHVFDWHRCLALDAFAVGLVLAHVLPMAMHLQSVRP